MKKMAVLASLLAMIGFGAAEAQTRAIAMLAGGCF